jgi:hypothetical protein
MKIYDNDGEIVAKVYEAMANEPTQNLVQAVVKRDWKALVGQLDTEALIALHIEAISRLGSLCDANNNKHLACPNCGNTGKETALYIRGELLLEYTDGEFTSAQDAEDDLNFYAENTCYCPVCDFSGTVYEFLPKKEE